MESGSFAWVHGLFPPGNNFRQCFARKSGRAALLLLLTLFPFVLTFPLLFTLEALLLLLPGDRSHQSSSTGSRCYFLVSSLFIQAYNSRWVSITFEDICACCLGRIHWHSLATMERYDRRRSCVIASCCSVSLFANWRSLCDELPKNTWLALYRDSITDRE